MSPKLVKQNALKRGVKYADEVNTVSPTHAREVMRKEYGEGMEKLMVKYRSKVSGIINGLDYKEFDPAKDPLLFRRFTLKNWQERREENKAKLQELFELPVKSEKMLLGYVGRLANQKGVGLIIEAMKKLLIERDDIQLVVLGGGDESYRRSFDKLGQLYPDKVGLHLLSNFELPRKIFTGVDALILPSLYEPGGIVALEAMRYGAVPLVRRTGGLNDVIQDFEPNRKKGNGFSFESKDAWGLYGAIMQALTTYQNHKLWAKLVLNCLKTDYSWEKSAREYQRWYRAAIKKRKKKLTGVPHRAYTKLKPMVVR